MSEEELRGILRLIQDRLDTIIQILNRMENRQIEVKKTVESETQGSFASSNQ